MVSKLKEMLYSMISTKKMKNTKVIKTQEAFTNLKAKSNRLTSTKTNTTANLRIAQSSKTGIHHSTLITWTTSINHRMITPSTKLMDSIVKWCNSFQCNYMSRMNKMFVILMKTDFILNLFISSLNITMAHMEFKLRRVISLQNFNTKLIISRTSLTGSQCLRPKIRRRTEPHTEIEILQKFTTITFNQTLVRSTLK